MMGMVVTMVAAMRMLSGVMDWLIRLAAAAPASDVWYWFKISTRIDCMVFRFWELVYK